MRRLTLCFKVLFFIQLMFAKDLQAYIKNPFDEITLEGDFLYWSVEGDGYDYLFTKTTTGLANQGSSPIVSKFTSKIHTLKGDPGPGFRVGVRASTCEEDLDVFLSYTHFNTKEEEHVDIPTGLNLNLFEGSATTLVRTFGTFLAATPAGRIVEVKGKLNLNFNRTDLEFGKTYQSDCTPFQWRPFVLFTYGSLSEHLKSTRDFVGGSAQNFTKETVKLENKFRGGGAGAGAEVGIKAFENFEFLAKGSASYLYGKANVDQRITLLVDPLPGALAPLNAGKIKESGLEGRWLFDLSLGILWKYYFWDCFPISLSASWESTFLPLARDYFYSSNANSEAAFGSIKKNSTLILQGLTAEIAIDF